MLVLEQAFESSSFFWNAFACFGKRNIPTQIDYIFSHNYDIYIFSHNLTIIFIFWGSTKFSQVSPRCPYRLICQFGKSICWAVVTQAGICCCARWQLPGGGGVVWIPTTMNRVDRVWCEESVMAVRLQPPPRQQRGVRTNPQPAKGNPDRPPKGQVIPSAVLQNNFCANLTKFCPKGCQKMAFWVDW